MANNGPTERESMVKRMRAWIALCLVAATAFGMGAPASGQEADAEAPVVREIQVVGNVYIPADQIKYRMRTREGQPLDREVLQEDFNRLWKMNAFSDVQIQEETVPGGVRLRVVVKEKAVIRRIVFRGNRQVSDKALRKKISSAVGQNYDPGIVNRDVRAIEDWYQEEYYYFTDVSARTEPFEDGVRLVFEIDERSRAAIEDVIFHGNEAIGRKELLEHMATRPSGFFNRGKYDRKTFEEDLERLRLLYQSKGYLDAQIAERPFQITGAEAESKWRQREIYIHIDIDEGEVWRIGRISFQVDPVSGEPVYDEGRLREELESLPGEPYSPITAQNDARRIRDLYGTEGRIFTRVRPERILADDESTVVDLVFDVQESKQVVFEELVVTGLVKTRDEVVRREAEIYPGEVFDSTKMDETVKNLNRLDFFERPIEWDVQEGSEPDRAKVVVGLKEKPTGRISFGVGVSSADGVVGSVSVKQRNFDRTAHPKSLKEFLSGKAYTGAGEYFSASLTKGSVSEGANVDYVDPWVLNRPLRFGTGIGYSDREWETHSESRFGAYFLLGQRIFGKNWDLSGRYKIDQIKLYDLEGNVSRTLRNEEGENWTSRVVLRLAYDTRDDIFDPTKGWYAFASQELAGGPLMGDRDFWRSHVEANWFHTFWRDASDRPHVLALRGEMAWADAYGDDSRVPLYDRYYAGGIGSLRGFDFHSLSPYDEMGDPIGGEQMTTASAEYFFPIFGEVVRGSAYYDYGAVREHVSDHRGETRSSTGFGLHVRTPLGPLPVRVYYNIPLAEEDGDDTARIQFTFGALF